ncbi:MAG: glycosyltransferase family 4 protein [Clostridiales bacterium]|nr:glycosyltransferase family 4 protein [Clostridiales bacterium]
MRILIPSIQAPFIRGGGELMVENLNDALLRYGHQSEIVKIPFKFNPASYVEDIMEIWQYQDFNNFNGYNIDKVIVLQFPAFYVKHDHKILWLMHQYRAVYELFDDTNSAVELKCLREKIIESDNRLLGAIDKRYSMCQNISNRLMKHNGIESTPLYHPVANENRFYSDDHYGYIFYPSRLEKLKRQDLLIRAMKYTKTNVIAIIAGTGSQTKVYKKMISDLGIESKVKMLGYISDEEKYVYYARSLAVFFAPYDEDYGYITLEAMLSSKPVITCRDSGGPLEFVSNEETGFVVDPDPMQIAEKIDWLYSNQKKARNMGQNGRQHYLKKNITWENVVERLLGS